MTDRRWTAGERFELDGIRYRVRLGGKPVNEGEEDLVLEHETRYGWRPVEMPTGFLLADFFFENEHVIYPRSKGYDGGWKYLKECQNAALNGWRSVAKRLAEDKARKRARGDDAA